MITTQILEQHGFEFMPDYYQHIVDTLLIEEPAKYMELYNKLSFEQMVDFWAGVEIDHDGELLDEIKQKLNFNPMQILSGYELRELLSLCADLNKTIDEYSHIEKGKAKIVAEVEQLTETICNEIDRRQSI